MRLSLVNSLPQSRQVHARAETILQTVNGIGKLNDPNFVPVGIDAVAEIAPDGARRQRMRVSAHITGRARIVAHLAVAPTNADTAQDSLERLQISKMVRALIAAAQPRRARLTFFVRNFVANGLPDQTHDQSSGARKELR